MEQKTRPQARLVPLSPGNLPELKAELDAAQKRMGFIPNSVHIMGRKPKMVKAYQACRRRSGALTHF